MTPHAILKRYFHYQNFRPGQREIIQTILTHRDTLAILPTGGGKSLCFQIPALIFSGITLVISPLISLMKDQVETLQSKGIKATLINSSLSHSELKKRLNQLHHYKLVYLSPEKLGSLHLIKLCQQLHISQVVIDEAHCISMWGHDFRPSYQQINNFVSQLPTRPQLTAFTATATPLVRQDISQSLHLSHPKIFLNSFARDNLFFSVTHYQNSFTHHLALFTLLKKFGLKPGIIYTSTRFQADFLTELIRHYLGKSFPVAAYHGGLKNAERDSIQTQFLNNQLQLIVATNAFGMGVDKSNVRWVIHFQIPGNLENYYQEAGRAGRDGLKAECHLLFNPHDLTIQQQFLAQVGAKNPHELPLHHYRQHQLQQMINYTHTTHCRSQFILNYFNETTPPCHHCDRCQPHRLTLTSVDRVYAQQLLALRNIFPPQVINPRTAALIALHRPRSPQQLLKLPGVGEGFVQEWYNQLSKYLK